VVQTTSIAPASVGDIQIKVASTAGFNVGDAVQIGLGTVTVFWDPFLLAEVIGIRTWRWLETDIRAMIQ
jgi:hypothetical protein